MLHYPVYFINSTTNILDQFRGFHGNNMYQQNNPPINHEDPYMMRKKNIPTPVSKNPPISNSFAAMYDKRLQNVASQSKLPQFSDNPKQAQVGYSLSDLSIHSFEIIFYYLGDNSLDAVAPIRKAGISNTINSHHVNNSMKAYNMAPPPAYYNSSLSNMGLNVVSRKQPIINRKPAVLAALNVNERETLGSSSGNFMAKSVYRR